MPLGIPRALKFKERRKLACEVCGKVRYRPLALPSTPNSCLLNRHEVFFFWKVFTHWLAAKEVPAAY